ncbi:nucleotide sugar dehydrogenase [Planococcus shenhongbingii]|uniref:Nucleotide sugar dehydrogenase n=1 Tax=Planococcus shenhongbingii TaxID=3058398 RepID=A0ABT8N9W8_9BACL|nr:nucleotide sugar dehydrogenase [Planococcus sp. N017]MDN7244681.1 nucleotide sugar dehydrogenase [Planococcus sp. N017]
MREKICIVGLGYVGLPLAVEFAKKHDVIGFDINNQRVSLLKDGIDQTQEVTYEELKFSNIKFSTDPNDMSECNFIIVTVPTPITVDNLPDLAPLKSASMTIGSVFKKGTIVIYESTVYPGVTEEECLPILESTSQMRNGIDFFVGYSPERINPGDKKNKVSEIVKVVSGQNKEVLEKVAVLYESIINAGVYRASSIKVAEAAKVIENTQRDLNISLMNELAVIFERLDIDTTDVLNAAASKWNFLKFQPGLVGGHCIAVDPYYLTYKAEKVGYIPEVILAGRRVNDNMGRFIASTIVKKMIKNGIPINDATVSILGITFKENVTDIRNSRVVDLIKELKEYGLNVQVIDEFASKEEVAKEFDVELIDIKNAKTSEIVVLAVPHDIYVKGGWNLISRMVNPVKNIVIDIKSTLNSLEKPDNSILWRL